MRERNQLASQIDGVRKLEAEVADALELIELAEADADAAMTAEALGSLRALAAEAKQREISQFGWTMLFHQTAESQLLRR